MPFPDSTVLIDDFNRPNEGPPATGWTATGGDVGHTVVDGQLAAHATLWAGSRWALKVAAPHEYWTTPAVEGASGHDTYYTAVDDSGDGYEIELRAGTDRWQLIRKDAEAGTVLGSSVTQAWTSGDQIGFGFDGDDVVVYQNGVEIFRRTDGNHRPAEFWYRIVSEPSSTARYDDFGGQPAPAPDPPVPVTGAATAVDHESAVLNGTVDPNGAETTAGFQYGPTTSYGTLVAAAESPLVGDGATAISKAIAGLAPETTYHFQAGAYHTADGIGAIVWGDDETFTTAALTTLSARARWLDRVRQGELSVGLPITYAPSGPAVEGTSGDAPGIDLAAEMEAGDGLFMTADPRAQAWLDASPHVVRT